MPSTEDRLLTIFSEALERPAAERAMYLDQACGTDADLRARVEALLRAHDEAGLFLDDEPESRSLRDTTRDGHAASEGAGTIIGPYKLLELIGEGGMGAVWMAEQREPVQRKVALKIIKAGMDTGQVVARFEAERQALALMDHPNIAKVFDGGTTDTGRPYFVMELVKGTLITKYCDDHQLTPNERLELFVPVCQAIQHAHQKGIIHRDLKPANVLVAPYDGVPVPKVIDFGVAKATGQRLTERTLFTGLGAVVGTLEYMSPEQAELNNHDIDTRSDIYALGVLLYELLTGTTPLRHERLKELAFTELLRAVREEEPPKPSTRLSESKEALLAIATRRHMEPAKLTRLVRGELDWIVMKALEKDRDRRYETANGFAVDVQHYLADEPVRACPPTLGYRLRKVVRRNKGRVVAAGLVLLVLVAGLLGTTWGLVHADKAREVAVAAQLAEADRAEGESRAKEEAQKAYAAERNAREAETAQRRRAEENTKLAMAVLDEIILKEARQRLTPYMQDEAKGLARNPEREKVEREFLEKGLRFYEKLAQTNATDWTARRETAKAYANVGLLRLDLKNYLESEKAYRQAVHVMEELARERPDDFDNAYDLANTYHWFYRTYWDTGRLQPAEDITRHALALFEKLADDFPNRRSQAQEGRGACQRNLAGVLKKAGRHQEAAQAFRQSLGIWAELTAANPQAARYRHDLAYGHVQLGDLFRQTGHVSKAVDAWRQALPLLEQVVAETNATESRWQLAGSQERLASALEETGQPQEAEKHYRAALAVREKLAAEINTRDHRLHLAGCLNSFGILLERTDQLAEAENASRGALSIWEKLVGDDPANPFCRQELALTYGLLGGILEQSGRVQEAQHAFRQAVAIHERLVADFPSNAEYRSRLVARLGQLAESLLQDGQHTEAAKVVAKMAGVLPKDANGYQGAVVVLARCRASASRDTRLSEADRQAVAQAYANRACELLQEAAKRGLDSPLEQTVREALRLPPDDPEAHHRLGNVFHHYGQYGSAEAEFREALRLRPDFPEARASLRLARWHLGRKAEVEDECREAMRLHPDDPEAYFTLGLILGWDEAKPAAAVRFYAEAFAAHPKLADDLRVANRDNAACAAALAGRGQGKDAAGLDEAERSRLRQQALDWLRADLTSWGQLLDKEPEQARARVQRTMRYWQWDGDFAGVRGDALAKLPEPERQPWQQLWADVEQTLRRVAREDAKDTKTKPLH